MILKYNIFLYNQKNDEKNNKNSYNKKLDINTYENLDIVIENIHKILEIKK